MGRPKQLLPLAGTTLIDVTVQRALASRLERIVVVTGAESRAVEDAIAARDVEIVHNPDHFSGNLSSLRAGVTAANAEAVVLILGDMPGTSPDAINALLETWDRKLPWAAVSSYDDGEGHPFLLSRAALDHSLRLEGPKPLWRMLRLAPNGEVVHVEIVGNRPPDIDTPDDYEELLASWSRPGTPETP